jgi:hypothetical protein
MARNGVAMTVDQWVRHGVGPRLVGGVYCDGAQGLTYRVEALYFGAEAARALGRVAADWAIEVTDTDADDPFDAPASVHCVPWDRDRDYVVVDPMH